MIMAGAGGREFYLPKPRMGGVVREFHLPKRAIQRVQSFLSSREAAQSTILSKSWRNAWLTRPNLDFDQTDFYHSYGPINEFSRFANTTLKRYELSNKKILSFRLLMDSSPAAAATKLILRALKIGATRFSVQMYPGYVLPDELFRSERLVSLDAKGCTINPNQVIRCSGLESLSLDSCKVEDSCIIVRILSSCPMIRSLSLSHVSLKGGKHGCDYDSDVDYVYDDEDDYDYDYYDGRIIPHGLRSMVLKYVDFDTTVFLSDLSTRFPSLKDLSLYMFLEEGVEEILISSPTLEHLTFVLQWSQVSKPSRVRVDVPSIRKFTYEGSVIPSLSFGSTSRRYWESCVSIIEQKCLRTSWFRRLDKFLKKLRRSRILSLALYVYSTKSYDYDMEVIHGLRKPREIENLTIDFEGLPSLSCYALLDGVFRICHPKYVTQCGSANNIGFLGQTLLHGLNVKISNPSQFMYGLNDLREAEAQIFDEVFSTWRDEALDALLDYSTTQLDNRIVRFQLNWQSFNSVYGGVSHAIATTPVGQIQQFILDTLAWIHDDYTPKYKANQNQRRRKVDFEAGDFVWIVLIKKRFPTRSHRAKLAARKIGPVEIMEKINSSSYRLQLPSHHFHTSDAFHVKHLVPYTGDYSSSDEEESYSRENLFNASWNDEEQFALQFMEKFDSTR